MRVFLLNQLGLRYSGERRALEVAEVYQALPVTVARRSQIFRSIVSLQKIHQLELPNAQKWQIWTLDEERRRTGYAIWVSGSPNLFVLTWTYKLLQRLTWSCS